MRVSILQDACNSLRQIKFFLMAIEFKVKEKQLLIQLFEYGDDKDKLAKPSGREQVSKIVVPLT